MNREAAARYGLRVGDVNDVIETAIGGKTIATTVEGRERYPISVRYARDFRSDLESLKRVLVAAPMIQGCSCDARNRYEKDRSRHGAAATTPQDPYLVARESLNYRTGPPSIRNENGQLVGFVFVDITNSDIEGYVRAASQRIHERVKFPPGYYMQWAGQFE